MVTELTASDGRPRAPGDLWLLQELVNTRDVLPNTDELPDVASLRRWLVAHEVLDEAEADELTARDLARVTTFREAMRVLLRTNLGDPVDSAALALLNAESARTPLRVELGETGCAALVPAGRGADRVLGRLLAGIAAAEVEGNWKRLKVCADDTCEWAYYDVSRNASKAWCSMKGCGNRAKARRFRQRSATAKATP
ncbi:MAG TPA: CGNR zinc finger domain-containing protein [Candidatus Dormibacteraeota bacterium]|nr:CGNR zinc finger domain-containing protein [Candidatus Dormibacteraeota bacterium]